MKNFCLLVSILLCCGLLVSCQTGQLSSSLPGLSPALSRAIGLGEKVAESRQDLTPEQEYWLGRAVAAQILSRYPALDNEKANAYLNRLGQAIALHSLMPETFGGYHFLLLNTDEVNAFAAPGGLIFVTKGLIGLISGEGELAAVLAHEIAHVQNRDAVGAIQQSRLTKALTEAGKEEAGRYGSGRVPPELVKSFSDSVTEVTTALLINGYSRDQEYAADAAAKDILDRSGYDKRCLFVVLRTMQKRVPAGSAGFGTTHPTAAQRLEALRATASDQPAAETKERARRFRDALGALSYR